MSPVTLPQSLSAASISFGVPYQNTLGYNAHLQAFVHVTVASVATLSTGVSAASVGIPMTNLVNNTSGPNYFSFLVNVPTTYWFQLNAIQLNGKSISASVDAQWQPV